MIFELFIIDIPLPKKPSGNRGPTFKLGGVSIFPRNILACQQELEPLEKLLPPTSDAKKS